MEDRQLFAFSVAFTIWALASILIPYIRRKTDLLTARNFFLFGGLLYVGLSGVNATRSPHYFDYSAKTYQVYYLYIVVFFAVFTLAYKRLKWPGRWADKTFQRWPVLEGPGLWFPLALALAGTACQVVVVQVPGLEKFVSRTGMIAPVFALAFALCIWKKQKLSPTGILLVAFVFLAGAYLAFSAGGGRRPLYSLAITAPCCVYWWYLRYRKPIVTLSLFTALLVVAPIADSAYRAARWYGHFGAARYKDVGASTRWEIFKQSLFSTNESFEQSALQIGHNSVENMLLVAYIFYENPGRFPTFKVRPFHSVYVILTLPIPRAVWEEKPRQIGLTLPYDTKILSVQTARTNWGPGIAAHGIHDGGLIVLIIYALLAAGAIRYFDELLVRHPDNPYLLGFISAASVQITGFTRGDIATMVPLTMLCFGILVALLWTTRVVLGTESSWKARALPTFAAGGRSPTS